MARACCLAAVAPESLPALATALAALAFADTTVTNFDIALLCSLDPEVLVIDVDQLSIDPLEALRQLRFMLPDCIIIAYTAGFQHSIVRGCHNAGANAVLSKASGPAQLVSGLRDVLATNCFTDPLFTALPEVAFLTPT
jgi:DNA-binding NarL/FixJ family response regulator